jgi:hypothetical protein
LPCSYQIPAALQFYVWSWSFRKVTVYGTSTGGVDPVLVIVSVEKQLGLQLGEDNGAVASVGKPEAEKVTA